MVRLISIKVFLVILHLKLILISFIQLARYIYIKKKIEHGESALFFILSLENDISVVLSPKKLIFRVNYRKHTKV